VLVAAVYSDATAVPVPPAGEGRTILGHPPGLFTLFFTEMWERFSFYSMRAFLTLYVVKVLLLSKATSTEIFGAYLAFVYASTFPGGILADRLLGQRLSIYIGGLALAASQFMFATHAVLCTRPGADVESLHWLFFAALGTISLGNGFFKPNISTIVGSLYQRTDPRRDGAFTIFYMGINIGAFLAGFSGQLAESIHWAVGFFLAGVGMLVGLTIFTVFRGTLQGQGYAPAGGAYLRNPAKGIPAYVWLALGIVLYIPLVAFLISRPQLVRIGSYFVALPIVGYLVWEVTRAAREERGRMIVLLVLCSFSAMFWGFYDLHGSVVNIFADNHVNRVLPFRLPFVIGGAAAPVAEAIEGAATAPATRPVGGTELKASLITGSTAALFVILLSIPFARLWVWLNRRRLEPSSPMKFALGLLQLGAGYFLIYLGAVQAADGSKAPLALLILGFFLHVTGELCLSPVGLSTITKLAPMRLVGMFMGVWFLSSALGHVLAGQLAAKADHWGYTTVFGTITALSVGAGVLLLILTPALKRLAGPTAAPAGGH
jgi:POT family proton-dependent oligopeptide transporter